MPGDLLPCPCCGRRTLAALDEHELCPVCFWEDDPRQSRDHDLVDGANGKSLVESRRAYARTGAMDEIFLDKVRPVRPPDDVGVSGTRAVPVERRASTPSRSPTAVITSAVTIGMASAVPVALLIVLGPAFGRAVVGGADLARAWEATAPTSDDWEVLPAFLVGAVVVSLVISVASAAVWLLIIRVHGSVWLAHAGATVAAAGVPLLLLAFVNRDLAVSAAVPAAVITLASAAWRGRRPPGRARGTSSA